MFSIIYQVPAEALFRDLLWATDLSAWNLHNICFVWCWQCIVFAQRTYTLFQNGCHAEKKLVQVARKRGHKGQFGWNKNNKVSQLTLQNNCHFPSLSNLLSSPWNISQTVQKTTLGPYGLIFVQLPPVVFFSHGGHFGLRCMFSGWIKMVCICFKLFWCVYVCIFCVLTCSFCASSTLFLWNWKAGVTHAAQEHCMPTNTTHMD